MNTHQFIQTLESAAAQRSFSPRCDLEQTEDRRPQIRPGQVWTTVSSDSREVSDDPFSVLILENGGRAVVIAVPILDSPELASSSDMILPPPVLGYEAAVLFGATLEILAESLGECQGQMAESTFHQVLAFAQFVQGQSSQLPEGAVAGLPLFSRNSSRTRFHQGLSERLAYLSTPFEAWQSTRVSSVAQLCRQAQVVWQRIAARCRQANETLAWAPAPAPAYAHQEQRERLPVVFCEDVRLLAAAEPVFAVERIPLPAAEATWMISPPIARLAGRNFAVVPRRGGEPLAVGKVNETGARLSVTEVLPSQPGVTHGKSLDAAILIL